MSSLVDTLAYILEKKENFGYFITLEPGIIGLGDEGRPCGVGRDVRWEPGQACIFLEELVEGPARERPAGVFARFDGQEQRCQRIPVMPGSTSRSSF